MLFSHFWKFNFSNFKMTFAKRLMKKILLYDRFSKFLLKFYYLTKFNHKEIFDSIMVVLSIFFAFYTEVHFPCLILSLRRFAATEILKWLKWLLKWLLPTNTYVYSTLKRSGNVRTRGVVLGFYLLCYFQKKRNDFVIVFYM